MTDKEVGELWKLATREPISPGYAFMDRAIEGLVRKLVEERKQVYRRDYELGGYGPVEINLKEKEINAEALRDFGITEGEWKEAKDG